MKTMNLANDTTFSGFIKITYISGNNENQFDRNVDTLTNQIYEANKLHTCKCRARVPQFSIRIANWTLLPIDIYSCSTFAILVEICEKSSNIFEAEITRLNDDDRLQLFFFFQDFSMIHKYKILIAKNIQ